MYRFLLRPRWLGLAALAILLAYLMLLAGDWQLHRYRDRSAINHRVEAARHATPTALTTALPAPATVGQVGPGVPTAARWSRVSATGQYAGGDILVRGREVGGELGFELLTPLLLTDGTAVLVDRGWLATPDGGDASSRPALPPAPTGPVTAVGRLAPSEVGTTTLRQLDGRTETRRIALRSLAGAVNHPLYGGYLLLDSGQPGSDPALTAVPSPSENALLNAGYVVQWWLFSAMTLVGFVMLARNEARGVPDRTATAKPQRRPARGADRVDTADEAANRG